MQRVTIHPTAPQRDVIELAADILRRGGLVAFPTETVYGLGACALRPECVRRIFAAKGRPSWNPLIVHVTGVAMARDLVVSDWSQTAETLARTFWPGPLTLVLPRRQHVPDEVSAGLATVAVRAPRHAVALALIDALGEPVAAPSANRFQELSPTSADHVHKSLGDAVDLILDGGAASVGVESTVVDLTGAHPALLRAGGISLAELQQALPGVTWTVAESVTDGMARSSPGQVEKHYSPRAVTRTVGHADGADWQRLTSSLARPLGTLSFTLPASGDVMERLPLDAAQAQSRLYAALHSLEDARCVSIVMELPPEGVAWDALRDRMTRAAA